MGCVVFYLALGIAGARPLASAEMQPPVPFRPYTDVTL